MKWGVPTSALVVLVACTAGRPKPLTAPAPADADELFFCVVGQLNQLGYRVSRYDRGGELVLARSIAPRGKNSRYEPLYDELTVTVSHDARGDLLHVTATDRRDGAALIRRCAAPAPAPHR